jgi:hypothetical protein
MRVDRGIDREETAVAAVSERYRGDNVLGVERDEGAGEFLLLSGKVDQLKT